MSGPNWAPFPPRNSSYSYNAPTSSPYPGSPNFEPVSYLYPGHPFALDGIALRAGALGAVGAAGLAFTWYMRDSYWQLPMFVTALTWFHFMEFWITARHNTRRAEVKSFLLSSNGAAYNIAHLSAIIEGITEAIFLPSLKTYRKLTFFGVALLIIGQLARTYAMARAGTNFSHLVAINRERGHVLVTHGIYKYIRHPSYFGFFWWGIGTQLMLVNPVCTVAYTLVLWKFFSARIREEEKLLISFFGKDYIQYKANTRTLIPFIN